MIEVVLLLIAATFLFITMGILANRGRIIFAMMGVITSLVTAAQLTVVQLPYAFYDETLAVVVTGTQSVTHLAALCYLFLGLGLFSFAITAILLLEFITGTELTEGEIGD